MIGFFICEIGGGGGGGDTNREALFQRIAEGEN